MNSSSSSQQDHKCKLACNKYNYLLKTNNLGKINHNHFNKSSNSNKEATRACNCQEKAKDCLMSSRNSKQLKQTRSRATDEREGERENEYTGCCCCLWL